MSAAEWKKKCEEEWGLQGAPMPDSVDWKSVYEARPLGRNLLKIPSLPVVRTDESEQELRIVPGRAQYSSFGDFYDWTRYLEPPELPSTYTGCGYGWFMNSRPCMKQVVDLKKEGLWDELLDKFQPEIVSKFCYDENELGKLVPHLQVVLLGADESTVIAEQSVKPSEGCNAGSPPRKEVSHVFSGYGPGVRYIHFKHDLSSLDEFPPEIFPVLSNGSSVIVKPTKTSS
ncbi:F-box only protein 50-like [Halichoeres trimaculatus]|uniref:F-box only protein 50-like n=1 Tax=Halichoeres trimaculatus TaxID=147232 RepID=UPI003D9F7309